MKNINIKPEEIDTVIYHKNCSDGFGAAWSAWKKLNHKASYIPASYGSCDFIKLLKNRTIAVLDFSFSEEEINLMLGNCNRICIIDHHKTALRIQHLENVHLDMNQSGAVLAWKYFNPKEPVPTFLKYIQDRDLWKWQMPESKEFSTYFQNVPKKFESYSSFLDKKEIKNAIKKGKTLLEYQAKIVQSISSRSKKLKYKNYNLKIVNSSIFQSEIGDHLSSDSDAALIWYTNYNAKKNIASLRSKNDIDVSILAQDFGGGGHKNASGFSFDINQNILELLQEKK